ncbi:hypothetical protein BS50DRAFT_48073 [Corynespora cassiicola Philippines]|uniref:Uncharacterized protein n=1 Tax=Corynespora cassiicola Philippines TaxID=1448308 RepID=A0A2T2NHQ0_CORCC|nr:hypothetical protein BS50DRAFT_48073 [Corynespora cassiicola Philippines]
MAEWRAGPAQASPETLVQLGGRRSCQEPQASAEARDTLGHAYRGCTRPARPPRRLTRPPTPGGKTVAPKLCGDHPLAVHRRQWLNYYLAQPALPISQPHRHADRQTGRQADRQAEHGRPLSILASPSSPQCIHAKPMRFRSIHPTQPLPPKGNC